MIVEGIIFAVLGFLAIALPVISTLSVELFVGWLLLFGGAVQLYRTFRSRGETGFVGSLITGILYAVFGVLLLLFPLAGIISLTIMLTFFFIAEGISKIYLALQWRGNSRWGWLLLSGILALVLAFIIYSGWPGTAYWALGLLVGINMLFFGITLVALALSLPKTQA